MEFKRYTHESDRDNMCMPTTPDNTCESGIRNLNNSFWYFELKNSFWYCFKNMLGSFVQREREIAQERKN
jgi:hypothetical protein